MTCHAPHDRPFPLLPCVNLITTRLGLFSLNLCHYISAHLHAFAYQPHRTFPLPSSANLLYPDGRPTPRGRLGVVQTEDRRARRKRRYINIAAKSRLFGRLEGRLVFISHHPRARTSGTIISGLAQGLVSPSLLLTGVVSACVLGFWDCPSRVYYFPPFPYRTVLWRLLLFLDARDMFLFSSFHSTCYDVGMPSPSSSTSFSCTILHTSFSWRVAAQCINIASSVTSPSPFSLATCALVFT